MSKISILAAGAVGYVLGARAGRERYEQIKDRAQKFAANPKVQEAKDKATDAVATQASAAAGTAAEKIGDVTSAATDKVRRDTSIQPGP